MRHVACITSVLMLALCAGRSAAWARVPTDSGTTIILDASDFLDEIPKGHTVTNADRLGVPWMFNNTALVLGSRTNYIKRAQISEPGTYYLYARTMGHRGSRFRVAIGDQVIDDDLGDDSLRLERTGRFDLQAGTAEVRLMRIEPSPVLDVLVLTKDPTFKEADLHPHELDDDVALLRDYEIPEASAAKFGDVNGDGQTDFMVLTPDYSARVFDFSGKELWSYEAPSEGAQKRASFEAPGLLWDLDQDGAAEAIQWRVINGKEWLVVADGQTGAVEKKTPWPTPPRPHVYNNFRIAIGRLHLGYPDNLVLLTDTGGSITVTAYDAGLDRRWQHTESRKKDHLGHYVYPVDLDGNGVDEVVVGSLVLEADGKERWNDFDLFYDNHDHVDSYRFADLDHDGQRDVVTAHSEDGVVAYDALTGKMMWQNVAEHSQQIEVADVLEGVPSPQVAIGARTYGNREAGEPYLSAQVWWFDPAGHLISKWPGTPLNGNPVFVKGDWEGNGEEDVFWYKFHLQPDGSGTLYFGEPVYHMFDFMGDGAEEVITLEDQHLKVYGYQDADPRGKRTERSPGYLQHHVANHSHYS